MARSYQCWDCGRQVSGDNVKRYEVTRHSVSSGQSLRVNTRRQRVNLCPECVAKRDRRDVIVGIVGVVIIAAVLIYFFLLR